MNNPTSNWPVLAILFFAGILGTPASASAQWQQVFGPAGGDVEAIASDAGHIYAGTDSGVYVSTNDGKIWTLMNSGLANPEIFSLAITPNATILAGTEGGGIFRSTNFGDTWDSSSTGLPYGSYILSLASDGHGNIYAGQSSFGVFYSSDDGLHWSARNHGLDSEIIFSLTIAPSGIVYAGGKGFIFSSSDFGQHWDTSLIATPTSTEEVLSLAADSAGDVFAGTFLAHRYRLTVGSKKWEDISPAFFNTSEQVHALATQGKSLYAGLFGGGISRSTDLGSGWSDFSVGLNDSVIYSLTAAPSGHLFAGTRKAEVFRANQPLAVAGENSASEGFFEVWPQPFQDRVNLAFSLDEAETAQLEIFDALGHKVFATELGTMPAARHERRLNLSSLPSGVYLFLLRTPFATWHEQCACLR